MGNTLDKVAPKKIAVADVEHYGQKLILPEGMKIPEAIDLLQRRMEYLTQTITMKRDYPLFPYDGANALQTVLRRRFGWAPSVPIRTMFGNKPPEMISVEVDVNQSIEVPWGQFELPGLNGALLQTGGTFTGAGMCFTLHASCKRSAEADIKDIFDEVGKECLASSLYRGKAFAVEFVNQVDQKPLEIPRITFMDTNFDPSTMVYSQHVQDALDTSLFTPIQRLKDLELNGLSFKSGVLLAGPFGVGKTLAARAAAFFAKKAGITYVYVRRADEVVQAMQLAKLYESSAAVVFCEDIDRVLADKRDQTMDQILNIVDGIDSKNSRIMLVATTNELEKINPAFLRPGRMDCVITIEAPNAEAVQRLIRVYGGDTISATEDLTEAGEALQGQIPAIVAEVVKRAKKAQIKHTKPGVRIDKLSGKAVTEAAKTIRNQIELLAPKHTPEKPAIEEIIGKVVKAELGSVPHDTNRRTRDVQEDAKLIKKAVGAG